jgi:hypothetical protein
MRCSTLPVVIVVPVGTTATMTPRPSTALSMLPASTPATALLIFVKMPMTTPVFLGCW